MNALAGGGTLITFPVLLLFHTPPVIANATSTLALMLGTGGSIYGYRRQLEPVRPWLKQFIPVSLVGGLVGSVLLTKTSDAAFGRMVPFLLLFATVLFIVQGSVRKFAAGAAVETPSQTHPRFLRGAAIFQLLVAVYGGYFGAGIGILMLATLGFLGLQDIHQMNTVKSVLGSLINLVATLWFIYSGLIEWDKAAVMTLAALFGYYGASHFAQKIPQARVRFIITCIGLGISAVTFYKQFAK